VRDTYLATLYEAQKQVEEEAETLILDHSHLLHWCCGGDLLHPLTSQASQMLYTLKVYI